MAARIIVTQLISRRKRDSSSQSELSSDEEWEEALEIRGKRVLRPRIKDYACTIVTRYLDHEFKSHFRMIRSSFEFILDVIRRDLMRKGSGCRNITPREQVLIAFWKMATMDSYRSVCDCFNVGKATGLRAVRRVTKALFRIAPHFIMWPTGDKAASVIRGFEVASGFPATIGTIDGTHIHIDHPEENPADYINRKGYASI